MDGMLTHNHSDILWWSGDGQPVVECAPFGIVCPCLLDELTTADGHLTGQYCEVQLKGASRQGLVHTREPCL